MFIRHGSALSNSSYDAFSGAHKLQCVQDLVMVREEMYKDVGELERRIQAGLWISVTNPLRFAFPGAEGFTTDAAVIVLKDPATGRVSEVEGR